MYGGVRSGGEFPSVRYSPGASVTVVITCDLILLPSGRPWSTRMPSRSIALSLALKISNHSLPSSAPVPPVGALKSANTSVTTRSPTPISLLHWPALPADGPQAPTKMSTPAAKHDPRVIVLRSHVLGVACGVRVTVGRKNYDGRVGWVTG